MITATEAMKLREFYAPYGYALCKKIADIHCARPTKGNEDEFYTFLHVLYSAGELPESGKSERAERGARMNKSVYAALRQYKKGGCRYPNVLLEMLYCSAHIDSISNAANVDTALLMDIVMGRTEEDFTMSEMVEIYRFYAFYTEHMPYSLAYLSAPGAAYLHPNKPKTKMRRKLLRDLVDMAAELEGWKGSDWQAADEAQITLELMDRNKRIPYAMYRHAHDGLVRGIASVRYANRQKRMPARGSNHEQAKTKISYHPQYTQ